jgi:hypothetical protein
MSPGDKKLHNSKACAQANDARMEYSPAAADRTFKVRLRCNTWGASEDCKVQDVLPVVALARNKHIDYYTCTKVRHELVRVMECNKNMLYFHVSSYTL